MRKQTKEKKKFIIGISLLLILFLGLGYAILTEQLKLNGSVNYGSMTWDVGFSSATDGGGTINSNPTIASDKKSITITCDIGTSTASETCIAKVKIKNGSSFAVELESNPTITFDNTYINSVTAVWTRNNAKVVAGNILGLNTEEEITITISTKELTKEMLPSSALSLPVTITMDWVENDSEEEGLLYGWSNKTAVFVGDSITAGSNTTKIYYQYLDEKLNLASATGMGVAGSAISATSDYGTGNSPLINRYTTIPNADLITVFMGTNDYGHETPLGTVSDKTDKSFYGALNIIVPALKELHPNSRIVFITPIHRYGFGTSKILGTPFTYDYNNNGVGANLEDYVNAIKEVCANNSIHVIDLFNLFTLDPTLESVRTDYMPDGLHPNASGHEIIANLIESQLKKIEPIESNNTGNDEEPEDENDILMVIGNQFAEANSVNAKRISTSKNIYMKAGTVISLKDSSTYAYVVCSQEDELNIIPNRQYVSGANVWLSDNHTITSDGWYGISLKRNDDADITLGGADPKYISDYITITEPA